MQSSWLPSDSLEHVTAAKAVCLIKHMCCSILGRSLLDRICPSAPCKMLCKGRGLMQLSPPCSSVKAWYITCQRYTLLPWLPAICYTPHVLLCVIMPACLLCLSKSSSTSHEVCMCVMQAPTFAHKHCLPQNVLLYSVMFKSACMQRICLVCHGHYTDQVVAPVTSASSDTIEFHCVNIVDHSV